MLEGNLFSAPEDDFREILYFRKKKKKFLRIFKNVLLKRYVISRNRTSSLFIGANFGLDPASALDFSKLRFD